MQQDWYSVSLRDPPVDTDPQQVRTVLERHQSDKTTEMARLAAVDTSVMRELSRKAQRDSRTLKVITILAMLYLPASFVSVSTPNLKRSW